MPLNPPTPESMLSEVKERLEGLKYIQHQFWGEGVEEYKGRGYIIANMK